MRQPNLTDVALFAAVVEAGGFRVAAQKRGMSASSISDGVRRLESDLGVRLLNRTTRSVVRRKSVHACWSGYARLSSR